MGGAPWQYLDAWAYYWVDYMKCEVAGFLLIQVLIYCLVFVILSAVLFRYAVQAHRSLTRMSQRTNDFGMLLAAHDLCVRDVQMGYEDPKKWHEAGDDLVVWTAGKQERGWWSDIDTIKRVTGRFDPRAKRWIASKKALVARIDDAGISIDPTEDSKKKKIMYVEVSCSGLSSGAEIAVESNVAPRNRVIG